eukprot:sb/3466423/
MGSGASSRPNFQRRPQPEVHDHMERLQRISDRTRKPVIKASSYQEVPSDYIDMIHRMKNINLFNNFNMLKPDLMPYQNLKSNIEVSTTIAGTQVEIKHRSDGKYGIDLSSRGLTHLPEEICFNSNMQQCSWTNLAQNKLESVEHIEVLMHLQEVYIGQVMDHGTIHGNRIGKLPTEVFQLPFLKILDISGCMLKELPGTIKNLGNIEVLSAARNKITEIPVEIEQLGTLKTLNLDGNLLTELPDFLSRCHSLRKLSVKNNRIGVIGDEVPMMEGLEPHVDLAEFLIFSLGCTNEPDGDNCHCDNYPQWRAVFSHKTWWMNGEYHQDHWYDIENFQFCLVH